MIICKTPLRISFLGGGTDLPAWLNKNKGGQVVSTSINKYGYIYLRELEKTFNYNFNIRYYLNEKTDSISKIKHPVVRKCLKYFKYNKSEKKCLHITYDGDLPSRAGLGSSSSFSTGLINAIHKLKKIRHNKFTLAKETINFEQNILKECVGCQDQIAAAYGGFNHIKFKKDNFKVSQINLNGWRQKLLNESLMICLIEGKRSAQNIEKSKIKNVNQNEKFYSQINSLTDESLKLINSNNDESLIKFGQLVSEYWHLKKQLHPSVTKEIVDYHINKFIKLGAYGCKLMGAGHSGFLLIIANKKVRSKIKSRFNKLKFIDVLGNSEGSKIIL